MGLDLSDPKDAWGRCLLETQAMIAEARDHGDESLVYVRVTGVNYPGREHWAALEMGEDEETGLVTDRTARQFSPTAASPWTGDLYDWLDDAVEWLQDDLRVEVRRHFQDEEPLWTDVHSREDVEPGPMTFSPYR